MEMLLLLFIFGGFGLLVAHSQLAGRVKRLELELEALRWSIGGDVKVAERPAAAAPPQAAPAAPTAAPAASSAATALLEAGDAAEAEPATPVRETLAALFERYVGGRLLIWAGGIALAVA